jgi:hypothetical protein
MIAPETDTGCLFCGDAPDGDDMLVVFTGPESDGWIHVRCRDAYVAMWREQ